MKHILYLIEKTECQVGHSLQLPVLKRMTEVSLHSNLLSKKRACKKFPAKFIILYISDKTFMLTQNEFLTVY